MNTVNIYGRIAFMTARTYHHGALHQAILDAAVQEARRHGPQGVQVRALAKIVGVSPAAFYRHVPSIDALLAEVAQAAREELGAQLADRREQTFPSRNRKTLALNRFRAVGRGYIDFALAEPHLFDTAFTPTMVSPPRPDDPSPWDALTAGITELVTAGVVPAAEADRAALIAWAGVHGIASILVRQSAVGPLDSNAAIDTVLDGVLRSLETL